MFFCCIDHMEEDKSIYIPHPHNSTEDRYQLLASKTFLNFSNRMWAEGRKLTSHPVLRNELTQLRHSLLSPSFASPLHTEDGAFLDFDAYFDIILLPHTKSIQHFWILSRQFHFGHGSSHGTIATLQERTKHGHFLQQQFTIANNQHTPTFSC